MVRKQQSETKLLTETELELMGILWKVNEGSVNDVIKQLSPGRNLAYTSVSTILRILEQKKIIGSRKEGRGHIYFPLLKKADYESTTLDHMVEKVFDGEPSSLIKRLIETNDLDSKELSEIKSFLNKRLKS